MAKNIISCGDVKKDVRHGKLEQVVYAFEGHLLFANGESDITILHPDHFVSVSGFDKRNGCFNSCGEVFKGRLFIFSSGRFNPRQPADASFRVVSCKTHLVSERKHVGK